MTLGRFFPVVAVYAVAEVALRGLAEADVLEPVQRVTLAAASALLSLAGGSPEVSGLVLGLGSGVVAVTAACLPLSALAVGLALVAADAHLPLSRRPAWALAVAATVLVANALRVAVVAWLASAGSPWLEPVHARVLPAALMLCALGVWWLGRRSVRA